MGGLNLNSLDYSKSPPATNVFNLGFHHTIFPLFNRPTKVAKTSAAATDHLMSNTFLQAEISNGIIKTEISDYFPIFATMKITITENRKQMWSERKNHPKGSKSYRKFLRKRTCKNKKNKIIQKTITFKIRRKNVRTILSTPGKYLKKWLVNPKSKRLFSKSLDYQQIRGN